MCGSLPGSHPFFAMTDMDIEVLVWALWSTCGMSTCLLVVSTSGKLKNMEMLIIWSSKRLNNQGMPCIGTRVLLDMVANVWNYMVLHEFGIIYYCPMLFGATWTYHVSKKNCFNSWVEACNCWFWPALDAFCALNIWHQCILDSTIRFHGKSRHSNTCCLAMKGSTMVLERYTWQNLLQLSWCPVQGFLRIVKNGMSTALVRSPYSSQMQCPSQQSVSCVVAKCWTRNRVLMHQWVSLYCCKLSSMRNQGCLGTAHGFAKIHIQGIEIMLSRSAQMCNVSSLGFFTCSCSSSTHTDVKKEMKPVPKIAPHV